MAAPLSTVVDIYLFTSHSSIPNRTTFRKNINKKCFSIYCKYSSNSISKFTSEEPITKKPSLSEQLKPLANTTLSTTTSGGQQSNVPSKPKSTWVNPTKPKRSIISPQRHKRSPYSHNPHLRDLKQFAYKLNDCDGSEVDFLSALEQIPHTLTSENALLILNSLKPWQKAYVFFNWMKNQNLFPWISKC